METTEFSIEAVTPLDANAVKSLSDFALKRVLWAIIVINIFFLAAGILFIFTDSVPMGGGFITFAIVFPLLIIILNRVNTRKNNELIVKKGLSSFYRFTAGNVYIESGNADMMQSSGNYTYDMLFSAYETRDYFFVYLNKMNAFVINKSGFIKGTPDDLRGLLSSKFGKKFKSKIR